MKESKRRPGSIKFNCDGCGKSCSTSPSTFKKHKKHFCSRECCDSVGGSGHNQADEYSSFRYFERNMKYASCEGIVNSRSPDGRSTDRQAMKYSKYDIDCKFLKQLWESQNGKCAVTKINMILPRSNKGWITEREKRLGMDGASLYNASLDRIHSDKPYCKSNVQFVCRGINFMKNIHTDEHTKDFIKEIVEHYNDEHLQ